MPTHSTGGGSPDDHLLALVISVLLTTYNEQEVRERLSATFVHCIHALQCARSAGWLTTYEFEEAIHVHRLCSDDNIHDTAAPHTTSQTYVKLNRAGVRNFARGTLTPPPQRPASANRRRRPSSAGRVRPSSARTGRESSEFTAWLETDRVSGTILSRAQEARNEAWGLGDRGDDGSMMPRLQARHRDPAAAVQTREEVYHGASGGGRDRGRSP